MNREYRKQRIQKRMSRIMVANAVAEADKQTEEAGVDKEVFGDLYECGRCGEVKDLSEFIDTECDGYVIGTCPNCGTRTMLLPVS